ncbi:transglycosylase SLT domain-containing protein [Candidatus Woesearchaeota archaeon]|nr:transglycosylase SLT domain-containing protein [Candidatus Woesearchaeota archaeon]
MRNRIFALFCIFLVLGTSFAAAQSIRDSDIPIFTNTIEETGESILVNAGKLEPSIVPTNILEEQDVPVYVFLKGATLGSLAFGEDAPEANPFYGIPEIERVSISGIESTNNLVSNVVHIKPKDRRYIVDESGRFFDMGYLILKLRKIKDEKELPQFNDTALARVKDDNLELLKTGGPTIDAKIDLDIRFNTDTSFGVFGAQDLRLAEQTNEKEWLDSANRVSFWGRNGYIRADRIRDDGVTLSVYDGRNRRIHGVTLAKNGDESSPIRLKEFGPVENTLFRIRLNSVVIPRDSAELEISGDIYNLAEGQRLYPGSNWKVEKIRNNLEVKSEEGKVISLYDEVTLIGKDGQRKSLKIVYFGEVQKLEVTEKTKVDKTTEGYIKFKDILDNDPEFIEKVEEISLKLNIDPNHLMAVMALESGFDPTVYNPRPDSKAIGLIQFIPTTADSLGTSTDKLREMSRIQQLEFVEKHFNPYKGKIRKGSLEDVYMVIIDPSVSVGKEPESIMFSREYRPVKYNANAAALDKDGDGVIYIKEATESVKSVYGLGAPLAVTAQPTVPGEFALYLENEDICVNVGFEDSEALDKTSNQIYCKSIQEIEESINKGLTGETLNEAYYRLGEANEALGVNNLYHKRQAILAYENIAEGTLYDLAQDKKEGLEEQIAGNMDISGANIFLEDENVKVIFRSIKVVREKDKASATLSLDNNQGTYTTGDVITGGIDEQNNKFEWKIESITTDKIVLKQYFEDSKISGRRETLRINDVIALQTGTGKTVTVQILDIDTKRQAYITILPGSGRAISRSTVDVKIPIERRAIQFSTEQIDWQINKTREVIKKLDSIIDKLDTTVKIWKSTCLGVFAFLSLKNLVTSSSEGEARALIMRGIDGKSGFGAYCNENSGLNKIYSSYDECIFKNQDYIEKRINEEKQNIINADNYVKTGYAQEYGQFKLNEDDASLISKQDARELKLLESQIRVSEENLESASNVNQAIETRSLDSLKEQLRVKREVIEKTKANFNEAKNYAETVSKNSDITDPEAIKKVRDEAFSVKLNELSRSVGTGIKSEEFANLQPLTFVDGRTFDKNGALLNAKEVKGSEYVDYLQRQIDAENDPTKKAKLIALKEKIEKNPEKIVVTDDGKTIYQAEGNYYYSETEDYLGLRIRRNYARANVAEYYENGRPFCVPIGEGNYVRVLEYYADGTAKTVDERNVGSDGELCTSDDVIINSDSLVKLNPQKEQELKRAAARAGTCAPGMYKPGNFICSYARAKAAEVITKLQCTDVMSISDCKILFNTCDPVMCPTSRFNLGGKWNVGSVPETGIAGSLFLGLKTENNPLSRVCYTGVLSGLEGVRSVFQGYEQCLQTAKVEGTTVGICDKVRSVFICENVWREAVAITGSVGGFSAFSGNLFGNANGGGEYAPNEFSKRLKQTSDSAKFFANDYATSSLAAYNARSLGEAGSQICRNIYAGKAPGIGKLIDQITTPESPPQFTAFFDEYPWSSDAGDTRLNVGAGLLSNVQEQSRYSVFYHIYAGRAADVRYSVYLKDRLGNIAYVTERAGGRGRGFIPREEFASKNIDFIGRSGFTEICVEINGREICGFGRASTDFGVNYINDKVVTNELQREIKTKEQCVPENEAGPTLAGIVTPENINTGDVTGGIVRVCSNKNPGEGGNEARWQVVGECGKDKEDIELGSCWIDTMTIRINDKALKEQTVQNIISKYDVKEGELVLGLSKELFMNLYNEHISALSNFLLFESGKPLSETEKNILLQTIGIEDDDESLRFIAAQSIDYGAIAQLRVGEIYLVLANDKRTKESIAGQAGQQTSQVASPSAATTVSVTSSATVSLFNLCSDSNGVYYAENDEESCAFGDTKVRSALSQLEVKKFRDNNLVDNAACGDNTFLTITTPWNNRDVCHRRTKGVNGCYYDSSPVMINGCFLCESKTSCSVYKDKEECEKWDPCVLDCKWSNNKCISRDSFNQNQQLNTQQGVNQDFAQEKTKLETYNLDYYDRSNGILYINIENLGGGYYISNENAGGTYPIFKSYDSLELAPGALPGEDIEVGYVSGDGSVYITNGEQNEQLLEKIKIKQGVIPNLFVNKGTESFYFDGNLLV